MSNYTKSTNFAAKDSLPSGNAAKIVKGTELDTEFAAIETAIGTKADTASPTFTGTPAAPTPSTSDDSTKLATTEYVRNVLQSAPAFSAYLGADQNLSNNTFTKILCGTEEFDHGSCYDNSSTYRFQPNVAGIYLITGKVANVTLASIYKNGSEIKRGTQSNGTTLEGSVVSALVSLNGSTDYVELYAYQTSGGTTAVDGDTLGLTYFQGSLVRFI